MIRKRKKKQEEDIDSDLEYSENNQADYNSDDSEEPDIFNEFLEEYNDDDEDDDPATRKKNLKKEFYVKRSRFKRRIKEISGIKENRS